MFSYMAWLLCNTGSEYVHVGEFYLFRNMVGGTNLKLESTVKRQLLRWSNLCNGPLVVQYYNRL